MVNSVCGSIGALRVKSRLKPRDGFKFENLCQIWLARWLWPTTGRKVVSGEMVLGWLKVTAHLGGDSRHRYGLQRILRGI